MATGISGAERLRDDEDWSVSHRDPPPIPTSRKSPTQKSSSSERFPEIGVARSDHFRGGSASGGLASPPPRSQHQSSNTLRNPRQEERPSRVNEADGYGPTGAHWPIIVSGGETGQSAIASAGTGTGTPTLAAERSRSQSQSESASRPRRGSIKELLRRTPTNPSRRRASEDQPQIPNNTFYTEPRSPPPIPPPRTLIAQAQQDAALNRQPSTGANMSMLRKVSRSAQRREAAAEEERKRKEAAQRPPPHLPSLPSLTPFSDGDNRPDSVAIFNQAYTTSASPSTAHSRPTNNFSRPTNMAPSSNTTNSSSPAYTSREGGAVVGSSPPNIQAKLVDGALANGQYVPLDTPNRTNSMTNRARFSFASTATNINSHNSPRRVRRKKDPTPFNILVIGAKNCGKTSFISLLQNSLSLPANKQPYGGKSPDPQTGGNRSSFTSTYLESDIDGERVGLTLWDSAGLEKNMVDLQLREMTAFIEAKFEETFAEEQKVMRTPGVKDTHIHCVFHMLDPVRLDGSMTASSTSHKKDPAVGSIDDTLDLQVMRALWGKTTVIPIIAKADTLTLGHMSHLKRTVWQAVKSAKLDPLEALELEDDAEDDDYDDTIENGDNSADELESLSVAKARKCHNRQSSLSVIESLSSGDLPYLPMSIISPDPYDMPPYVPRSKHGDKIGRRFPWGFADPYNADHCDFGRLRDSVFSEWRTELRELSRSRWYEQWRTSRLKNLPGHKQRIPGGVTPVAAVPKEGRIASQNSPNFSTQSHSGAANIPRSVSNLSSVTSASGNRLGTTVSGGGSRDPSGTSEPGSGKTGTVRSFESQSQR